MEKPNNPSAQPVVIFDFDGTLVDTMGLFYKLVVDNLEEHGIVMTDETTNYLGKQLIDQFHSIPAKNRRITLIWQVFWAVGTAAGLSKIRLLLKRIMAS